jgi:hypothetical protein
VLGIFHDECHICFTNFPYNLDVYKKVVYHYVILLEMLEKQRITCMFLLIPNLCNIKDSTYHLFQICIGGP